jgi:hypothetical protein
LASAGKRAPPAPEAGAARRHGFAMLDASSCVRVEQSFREGHD